MSVRLVDKATGTATYVEESDLPAALASKKYIQPEAVAVHRFGEDTYVAPDVYKDEQAFNPTVDPAQVALQRGHQIREDRNSGVLNTIKAGVGGAANMLSWGVVNPYEEQQEFHSTAATVGGLVGLGGQLLLGNDLGIGKLIGGAGEAREVSAARALASSADPLAAEHVASGLSSNALVGAAGEGVAGSKVAERALGRGGAVIDEGHAAGAAIGGVPQDLAGLDANGLRNAAAAERASIATAKDAEVASLQEQRVPLRRQVSEDVRALHDDLSMAGERPIYNAISTPNLKSVLPELKGIEGVQTAQVALADSFKTLRRQLRNTIAVADDPSQLVKTLQMRQGALETLQTKAPEIAEALGGDTKALVHVDDALAQTKEQIARIQSLNRTTPVSSAALTDLKSGTSPRLRAIEAAQDALKNAPGESYLQKIAGHEAYSKTTALMHMIPGAGILAPFVGKHASEMVSRLFGRLSEHGAASAAKSSEAVASFLDVGAKLAPRAPMVASKVLATARFAPNSAEATGKETLPELFHARSAEVRSQTQFAPDGSVQMRPEARAEIAKRLDPIASVNPHLADQLETFAARRIAYISSKIPRKPEIGGIQIGPDKWQPSDMEMRSWARSIQAAEDPAGVEERLVHGNLTPEDAEAYRTVYPQRFAAIQQQITRAAPTLAKTLPYARRLSWSVFAGVPIDPSMAPNVVAVLQGSFAQAAPSSTEDIPGMQPPKIQPQFGSMGSLKSLDKPTPAQSRSQG